MDKQKGEGIETAKQERKNVLQLFRAFHPDTGDTPFAQSASRLLSSVLGKIDENPTAPFSKLRWNKNEETMVSAGLEFTKPDSAPYSWSPTTPHDLVRTLEQFKKGIFPEPRSASAPSGMQSPLFEYDDTFTRTTGDREKTPPSPEELADVLYYAHTLSEMYNINFVVQRRMYEYDWFIKNARTALNALNTFLKDQTPAERNAYAGVTVELIGFMSHIKIAFLSDAVRDALVHPGTEGAAWESAMKFSINPASLKWERFELEGPENTGGMLGREFGRKREHIGYESHLKGDDLDVAEVQDWLVSTYGFVGIDVPDSMAEHKDDPEVRRNALKMFSFIARALTEAQYQIVEEGTPPDEKRVRKEVFTQQEVIDAVKGGYISLGVGDDRDGTSGYARETKDGVCIYVHEKLDSIWLIGNLQGLIRKKKEEHTPKPSEETQQALPKPESGE